MIEKLEKVDFLKAMIGGGMLEEENRNKINEIIDYLNQQEQK